METSNLDFTPKGLYIGGDWQESATGKTFETITPPTGDNLGDVPMADEADVDCAVAAAKTAFGAAANEAGAAAEVEVYAADHGWCVPDSPAYDRAEAERAWARLLATYARAL